MSVITITLVIYFAILLGLGWWFSGNNQNVDDFLRSGGKAEWWLGGASMLVAGISAFTFTGNASSAYEAGPTLLVIYAANCVAFLMGGLFLGAWLRQTRALNAADIIRERFGPAAEQFSVVTGILTGPFTASIQLWALAVFLQSVFALPVVTTIVVVGLVVTAYSMSGGRWAIMATDFVQGVLLFSITIVVGVLSYRHIGGAEAFISYFSDTRFSEDYSFVKNAGAFGQDRYTWDWIVIVFTMQLMFQASLGSADRFLSLKDGREAKKAAYLAMVLMMIGSVVWFLPPMVSRFLYADEIQTMGYTNAAEASYAFLALKLLPSGLVGILVAGMFAATMSSMDNGLMGQSGAIVRNLIPPIRRSMKMTPMSGPQEIRYCRWLTILIGLIVISYAILLSQQQEFILFEAYLLLGSVIAVPIGLPMLAALWIPKLPKWSFFVIAGSSLLPSAYSLVDEHFFGKAWTIQDRTLWVLGFGLGATLTCRLLYHRESVPNKKSIEKFYARMHQPVTHDKAEESADSAMQKRRLGVSCLVAAGGILALTTTAASLSEVLTILSLVIIILPIGSWLFLTSRRGSKPTCHDGDEDDALSGRSIENQP